jgi:hypothetical protein
MGNYLTSGAAASAAGNVGAANAITSGLGSYMNYSQSNNLINALNRQNTGGMPTGYGTVVPSGPMQG